MQQAPDGEGSSGEEEDGEGEGEVIEDSQILEDLPDETEVCKYVVDLLRNGDLTMRTIGY